MTELDKAGSGSVEARIFNAVVDALQAGDIRITVADIDSQASADGTVVTSDGSGNATWEVGGSQTFKLVTIPIAWDDHDLLIGNPVYTPTVGEYLYDGWITVENAWDGTTPQADIGLFTTSGPPAGFFATYAGVVDLSTLPSADAAGLVGAVTNPLLHGLVDFRGLFSTVDPVCVCITQTGAPGQAFAGVATQTNTVSLLPITVVTGVSDEFVYTDTGGMGTPETFTLAPGVYTTLNQCIAAYAAAVGAGSGERFDTRAQVGTGADFGGGAANDIGVGALVEGSAENGNTLTAGAHDGLTSFGWADPATFAGGTDIDPESTMGDAILYLLILTP